VQKSRLEEIRTRLGKGEEATAIVNQRSKTTALHVAANNGNSEAVSILMKSKSLDLEVRDGYDCSPLHTAAACTVAGPGAVQVIRVLLAAGAALDPVNQYGRTPLMEAAACGNTSGARVLVQAGAGLGFQDRRGRTALQLAAANRSRDSKEIVQLLNQPIEDKTSTTNIRSKASNEELHRLHVENKKLINQIGKAERLIAKKTEKVTRLEEERSCAICMDLPVSILFIPCKHLVCCPACSKRYTSPTCLICRSPIRYRIQVYFS